MNKYLTGWARLGIFLSVLWIIIISGIMFYQFIRAKNDKSIGYFIVMKNCSTGELTKLSKSETIELANLEAERINSKMPDVLTDEEMSKLEGSTSSGNYLAKNSINELNKTIFTPIILINKYLLICFLPIISIWLVFYVLFVSINWIIKGFKK